MCTVFNFIYMYKNYENITLGVPVLVTKYFIVKIKTKEKVLIMIRIVNITFTQPHYYLSARRREAGVA